MRGFLDAPKASRSNEWYTPAAIFHGLPEGTRFDLDPCGAALLDNAPATQWCDRTIRAPENGLEHAWNGLVWVNPPYSDIHVWLDRFRRHDNGVALVFARTDTTWWQDCVVRGGMMVLHMRKRVQFVPPDDVGGSSAGMGSALLGVGRGRRIVSMTRHVGVLVDYRLGHIPRLWLQDPTLVPVE